MSSLKAEGVKSFIWDFLGKMVNHGMGFIISILLARLLEPSDFGLVAMVMVIIVIAGLFSDSGLGLALIQRRRVLPIHYSSVFYFNIAVGALLTLLTFLSAPLIAEFYNNKTLIPLTQVISFTFIIGAFSAVQSTKLRKELKYPLLTKIGLISSFISGTVGVSLAFYGAGVWSLVAQSLIQGIIYSIIIWSASHWKPSVEFSLKALMQLWAFGFRMFLSFFLSAVFGQLQIIIIAKLFSPATLGFFNRAMSLNQMVISYSSQSLMSVLFPILSKVQNDLSRFQKIILKAYGILVFVVFLLLGGLYLVSHELIILLFGEKWLQSVEYFKILVLSGFGYPLGVLLVTILSSRGNSKEYLRIDIFKKSIFGINLLIIPIWGVVEYLYGLVVVMSLITFINIFFASKEIDLSKIQFIKPIIIQMILTVMITLLVQYINQDLNFSLFFMLVIKGLEYTFLYIIFNKILNTDGYRYFMEELKPVYTRFLMKMRNKGVRN